MPGMTGNIWFDATGLPRSPGGFVAADKHCHVPDWPHVYVAGDGGSFPGPDWMPKQAHMADLQADAAARNLIASLNGAPATATFRSEIVCIMDTLDKAILVVRTEKRSIILPASRLFHWAKRAFEGHYLRQYR